MRLTSGPQMTEEAVHQAVDPVRRAPALLYSGRRVWSIDYLLGGRHEGAAIDHLSIDHVSSLVKIRTARAAPSLPS